jgi:hypothetical protein
MLLMLGAMAVGGGDLTVVSTVLRLVESVTMGSAANAEAENIAMKMTIFFSMFRSFMVFIVGNEVGTQIGAESIDSIVEFIYHCRDGKQGEP